MGQKANPIGNRLGIVRGWDSNWFEGNNQQFAANVVEDERIRTYLAARRPKSVKETARDKKKPVQNGVSRIIIERSAKRITVTIQTSRPGIIIGRQGQEVDLIKEELKVLTGKDVQVNIYEIRKPDLDAAIVGENIAKQLEARINFRRAVKLAIKNSIFAGAQGIKIRVSGRLGGAEMSRTEEYKEGRTPLHTFRADIDYALIEAQTVYGKLGVKVWIFKGEVLSKRDLTPFANEDNKPARNDGRSGDNRGGDNRGGDRRGGDRGGDNRRGGGDRGGDNRRGGAGGGDRRGGAGGGGDRRGGGGGRR